MLLKRYVCCCRCLCVWVARLPAVNDAPHYMVGHQNAVVQVHAWGKRVASTRNGK